MTIIEPDYKTARKAGVDHKCSKGWPYLNSLSVYDGHSWNDSAKPGTLRLCGECGRWSYAHVSLTGNSLDWRKVRWYHKHYRARIKAALTEVKS